MDVGESPGNSIESIENYISERYPKDPRYSNNPDCEISCSSKPFEFPPCRAQDPHTQLYP